jgi:hypothetical protein
MKPVVFGCMPSSLLNELLNQVVSDSSAGLNSLARVCPRRYHSSNPVMLLACQLSRDTMEEPVHCVTQFSCVLQ